MIRHQRMCGPEVFIEAQKALCNRAAGGCCHLSPKALFWAHISVQSGCRGLLPLVTKSIALGPHVRAIGLPGVPATCHETLLLVYRMYKMGNAKCMHFWCGAAEPQSIRIGTNFECGRRGGGGGGRGGGRA